VWLLHFAAAAAPNSWITLNQRCCIKPACGALFKSVQADHSVYEERSLVRRAMALRVAEARSLRHGQGRSS
jgi:hypothetical protein